MSPYRPLDHSCAGASGTVDDKARTSLSKFLSFVLRHRPDAVGITLDDGGWVDVEHLLHGCAAHGRPFSRSNLEEVVATNAKRRFSLSADGARIRANQGHSIDVELGYEEAEPPDILFHGTVSGALASIREQGIVRMQRHHVHLSADEAMAMAVGGRRGKPIILRVDARGMTEAGHVFYCTPNGVWLTAEVPPRFILDLEEPKAVAPTRD